MLKFLNLFQSGICGVMGQNIFPAQQEWVLWEYFIQVDVKQSLTVLVKRVI